MSTSTGTPQRYRKKPVVIEAVQFLPNDKESTDAIPHFLEGCAGWHVSRQGTYEHGIVIPTLEGDHLAMPGDWIIKGVAGEFYPRKPDIFEATYEAVGSDDASPEPITAEEARNLAHAFLGGHVQSDLLDSVTPKLEAIIGEPIS